MPKDLINSTELKCIFLILFVSVHVLSLRASTPYSLYSDSLGKSSVPIYQEKNLDHIINEAKNRQNSTKDFSADFTYSLSFPRERNSSVEGSLIYQRGRYVVKLPEQDVFCDGYVRWYYMKAIKEVIIKDYEQEIGITMPFKVFDKGRSPRYSGTERLGNTMCDVIFFEEMSESAYKSAKVWIDKESRIVQKIILLFDNQGAYTFHFRNIKINKGYPSSTFKFPLKNYPGVSVIDERVD